MNRRTAWCFVGCLLTTCAAPASTTRTDATCASKLQQKDTQHQEQLAQQDAQHQGQVALMGAQLEKAIALAASTGLLQQGATLATGRRTHPYRRPLPRPPAFAALDVGAAPRVTPPPSPWRNAMAVAVDNTNQTAKDAPDCGVAGQPPCRTIRYGVSRALPNATVTVGGGGAPYLGECGGAPDDALSSPSGIQPPAGASLAVVAGVGGPVIIDCAGKGRAFRFNASSTAAAAVPGKGATLKIAGMEVRNGNAPVAAGEDGNGGAVWAAGGGSLEIEGSVFANGQAGTHGGAVCTVDVQLRVSGTSIVQHSATASAKFGGGIYAAFFAEIADLVVVDINASDFTDTHAGSGGGGAYIAFAPGSGMTRTTVRVRASHFTNTATDSATNGGGGGLLIGYYGATNEEVTTLVLGCSFDRARSGYEGGGLEAYHSTHARRPVTRLEGSSFTRTVAANGGGGGAGIEYYGGATDAQTSVRGCDFEGTRTEGVGSDFNDGGGLAITFHKQSDNVSTIVTDNRFRDTSASGGGGGVSVLFASSTNADTRIINTTFTRCSASGGGYGGGAQLHHSGPVTTKAWMLVDGTHFENCTAAYSGGGLQVQVDGEATGTSLFVRHSGFVGNSASGVGGGGAVQIDLPQDKAQNLRFVGVNDSSLWRNQSSGADQKHADDDDDTYNPFYPYPVPANLDKPCSGCGAYPNGCGTCPEFQPFNLPANPINPLADIYRSWTAYNTVNISATYFGNNTAGIQGGAIAVPGGGSVTIENTTIENNHAKTLFGGGASTGGTAQLMLINSTVRGNSCGQRGCQLFSSSGASMTFDRGSTIELGCSANGDCSTGLSAAQMGELRWGGGSAVTCAAGFQLLDSSAIGYSTTFDSWKLEAPSIFPPGCKLKLNDDDDDGSALGNTPFNSTCQAVKLNSNCPCYFSNNPFGGQFSKGFGRATIHPPVFVSTLSFQCRACPAGRSNPTPPTLGATNVEMNGVVGICDICPAGKVQGEVGQDLCDDCSPGTFQANRGQKACAPCTEGSFQLDTGAARCLGCPPGAACPDGFLVPKAGYYGTRVTDGLYAFTACPEGFCVESNDGKGEHGPGINYTQCAKGANRDWTVPLCGACLPGFSQSMSNANCVADETCHGTALWFWPAAFLYCTLYAVYFLWSSTPTVRQAAYGTDEEEDEEERPEPEAAAKDAREHAPGMPALLRHYYGDDDDDDGALALSHDDPAKKVGAPPSRLDALRRSRAGQALGGGSIPVIVFFFQMAGLVLPLKGA
jgi:hypothetical protein